ncbi:MAG: hypothetical protein V8S98_12995 [Lachnospiraceae bacterium]
MTSPDDIFDYFQSGKILRVHEKNENGLAKKEKMVYSCLDFQPKELDQIVILSGLSVSECIGTLLDLELGGYVVQQPINIMVRDYRRGVLYGKLFSCGVTREGEND